MNGGPTRTPKDCTTVSTEQGSAHRFTHRDKIGNIWKDGQENFRPGDKFVNFNAPQPLLVNQLIPYKTV